MKEAEAELRCKDCRYWYGAEDDSAGPCSLKHQRGDGRYLTWGSHTCDEEFALKEYGKLDSKTRKTE